MTVDPSKFVEANVPQTLNPDPSVTGEPPIGDQLQKQREDMRGRIAMLLIGALLLIIFAGFAPIWFGWGGTEDVNTLLDTFFTPMLTLVGTVAGFYFGEKVATENTTQRRGGSSPAQ